MNNEIKKQLDCFSQCGSKLFISDESISYSYQSFASSVYEKIHKLEDMGCTEKDGIMLGTSNGLDYFISIIATWAIECVAIPIDKSANQDVFNIILEQTKPKVIMGVETIDTYLNKHEPKKFPKNTAAILFTSGSSGTPKGVMLSSNALFGNAKSTLKTIDFDNNDHLFVNTPYHFTSAICHFLAAFFNRSRLTIINTKLLPSNLFTAIKNSGANAFGGAPIQLLWIVGAVNINLHLRWVMTSGDDLPESTQKQLEIRYPKTLLFVFYGLTECGGRFCARTPTSHAKRCSVGKPIPGMNIEIVDTSTRPLPAGKVGEIVTYGDYLMNGYLGGSDSIFTSKGGLRTGDSGYVDDIGNLYLLGRLDDVFKVAGQKVSGLRIRDAALQTNMIYDAVIIPFKENNIGIIPALIYVKETNKIFEKSLFLQTLRQLLPTNHIPRKLITVNNIERTGSGKMIKKSLVKNLAELNILQLEGGSFTEKIQ